MIDVTTEDGLRILTIDRQEKANSLTREMLAALAMQVEEAAADLDSVVFVDFQPPERLPEVLASGDVHLIALRTGLARSSVPSKLYSILAAGRPVFASIDPGTEVSRVLAENECGVSVPPEDLDAFESALGELIDAADERTRMGERGRAFVEGWASPAAVAETYQDLFAELTD